MNPRRSASIGNARPLSNKYVGLFLKHHDCQTVAGDRSLRLCTSVRGTSIPDFGLTCGSETAMIRGFELRLFPSFFFFSRMFSWFHTLFSSLLHDHFWSRISKTAPTVPRRSTCCECHQSEAQNMRTNRDFYSDYYGAPTAALNLNILKQYLVGCGCASVFPS